MKKMIISSLIAAMPLRITDAKIACLDFSLQKAKMHLGISVVVEDPAKLEAIRRESVYFLSLFGF